MGREMNETAKSQMNESSGPAPERRCKWRLIVQHIMHTGCKGGIAGKENWRRPCSWRWRSWLVPLLWTSFWLRSYAGNWNCDRFFASAASLNTLPPRSLQPYIYSFQISAFNLRVQGQFKNRPNLTGFRSWFGSAYLWIACRFSDLYSKPLKEAPYWKDCMQRLQSPFTKNPMFPVGKIENGKHFPPIVWEQAKQVTWQR